VLSTIRPVRKKTVCKLKNQRRSSTNRYPPTLDGYTGARRIARVDSPPSLLLIVGLLRRGMDARAKDRGSDGQCA
jgi:hypothetical protein